MSDVISTSDLPSCSRTEDERAVREQQQVTEILVEPRVTAGLDQNDCGPYRAKECQYLFFLAEIQIFIMGRKDLVSFCKV